MDLQEEEIIKTTDTWVKLEHERKMEEIRLADARARQAAGDAAIRSEKRWHSIKSAVFVVFFPIALPLYLIWKLWEVVVDTYAEDAHRFLAAIAILAMTSLSGVAVYCSVTPSIEEQYVACVKAWDQDACTALLHTCPDKALVKMEACREEKCKCVRSNSDGRCFEHEISCSLLCENTFTTTEGDKLFADCSQKMDISICEDVHEHCGPLP